MTDPTGPAGIDPPESTHTHQSAAVSAPAALRLARRGAFGLGATGLALAAGSDGLAVAGRHLGFRLLGSIELTQTAIVLLGSSAMLYATLEAHHASVHMLTARLSPRTQAQLARAMAGIGALVLLAVAAGSAWVMADMWDGHERTELLQLPIRYLRLLWTGCALAMAMMFARQALAERNISEHIGNNTAPLPQGPAA